MTRIAANRRNMAASQLFTNEVVDKRILQAMVSVPRENFLPDNLKHSAYVDEDLDVGNGRFLMAPMTFARLISLAEVTPESRVLIIGGLTGYSAAVLSQLAANVVAIDNDEKLVTNARSNLSALKCGNVDVQPVKSLSEGYAMAAPYNVIILEGAVPALPESLGEQLAVGGSLAGVRAISARPGSNMCMGRGFVAKRPAKQFQSREYFDASASLLPGFSSDARFIF